MAGEGFEKDTYWRIFEKESQEYQNRAHVPSSSRPPFEFVLLAIVLNLIG